MSPGALKDLVSALRQARGNRRSLFMAMGAPGLTDLERTKAATAHQVACELVERCQSLLGGHLEARKRRAALSKLSSRIHQHLRSLGSMTRGERELVCGALIRALAWHGRHPWKHESDRAKAERWRQQLRVLTEALQVARGDVKAALATREEAA